MAKDSNESVSGLVTELILIAKDNPETKEAAKNLASTAKIITGTLKRAVIPLAVVNYGIDKFENYIKNQFQSDMNSKTLRIPAENVIDPKESIAGPVLQGLVYTHTEESLKEMYLNLLASAMNSKTAGETHPSYVEIIKQLSSEEAMLLKIYLSQDQFTAVELHLVLNEKSSFQRAARHIVNLTDSSTGSPMVIAMMSAYIENWVRLGLFEVDYTTYQSDEGAYDWVEQRPEYLSHVVPKAVESEFQRILEITRGIMVRTKYGEIFGRVVGISS